MAKQTQEYLISKFETGDIPQGSDFADFIESSMQSSDWNAVSGASAILNKPTINSKEISGNFVIDASEVSAVPVTRTINGIPLSADIVIETSAGTGTINGYPISGNVVLTASDVSAVPVTRTINGIPLSADITISVSGGGGTTLYPIFGGNYDLQASVNFISFRLFNNSAEYVRPGDIINFIIERSSLNWWPEENSFSSWLQSNGTYIYSDLTSKILSTTISGTQQIVVFSEDISNTIFTGDNTVFCFDGSWRRYIVSSVNIDTVIFEFADNALFTQIVVSGVKFNTPTDFSNKGFEFSGYSTIHRNSPEVII